MKLRIENSIVIETEGKKVTLGQGEYEFDSVNEFIRFVERLGEPTKQPLIRDEKIRKAVRAWWESLPNAITDKRILYKANHDLAVGVYVIYCGEICHLGTLKEYKYYTIAELCGEGEE